MSKFYGKIGYVETVEDANGDWVEFATTKMYRGDVEKNTIHNQSGESRNDNINISNIISIIADPYAFDHIGSIRYIEWMGSKWCVTWVEVQYPRLKLTIGGVYNGPDEDSTA